MDYISAKDLAQKWGLNKSNVVRMCQDGRISGAILEKRSWKIPADTKRPEDKRVKSGRYRKLANKFHGEDRCILIVDDDSINRDVLGNIFENEYQLKYACDGVEAMDCLNESTDRISIVLLDLVMPRMDGLEVLRQMKAAGMLETIPVIMITAQSTANSNRDAYELGVCDIIDKPFDAAVVKQRATNYIKMFEMKKHLSDLEG